MDESICCDLLECGEGFACDPTTCGCDKPCCTEAFCGQTGESCDKTTCECVEKVCCTEETCAAEGLQCDPVSCECKEDTLGQLCPAFAEDFCLPGQWCEPTDALPEGGITGVCVLGNGTASLDEVCTQNADCLPGLGCVGVEDGIALCRPFCDPGAAIGDPGGCSFGEGCVQAPLSDPLGNVVAVSGYGFCQTACTTFVSQEATGCGVAEWCSPFLFSALSGECTDGDGLAQKGEPCASNGPVESKCAPGMICVGSGGTTECRQLCIPGATEDEPGDACADNETCSGLSIGNPDGSSAQLAIGSCAPSCGFHEDVPCEDETKDCSPGELFGNEDGDLCIAPSDLFTEWPAPEFSECPAAAQAGLLCGPNSVCLDIPSMYEPPGLSGDGIRCHDICIAEPGAFMGPSPDCRRPTAMCMTGLFADPNLGLCGVDM